MCRLCVCVLINKRSFEPFMCLGLIQKVQTTFWCAASRCSGEKRKACSEQQPRELPTAEQMLDWLVLCAIPKRGSLPNSTWSETDNTSPGVNEYEIRPQCYERNKAGSSPAFSPASSVVARIQIIGILQLGTRTLNSESEHCLNKNVCRVDMRGTCFIKPASYVAHSLISEIPSSVAHCA